MADTIQLRVYATRVVNGVVQTDSVLRTFSIVKQNDGGVIDTKEWSAATGAPPGFLRGTMSGVAAPALWIGESGNLKSGTIFTAVPHASGSNIKSLVDTLVQNKFAVDFSALAVCFLAGTLIETPGGDVPVESLKAGDLVITLDHGPQPLVWGSHTTLTRAMIELNPNQRPIRIAAGALGKDMPRRETRVSSQHRILLTGEDGTEYLVSAQHLHAAGTPGITIIKDDLEFDLVHIAFAEHQIVRAEGAPMESFFTGPMAMRSLSPAEQAELTQIFPILADGTNPMKPARPFLKRRDVASILAQHVTVAA